MLTPVFTNKFNKDLKKIKQSGNKNIEKIKDVIQKLVNLEKLEDRYRDHILVGNYKKRRECHIEPDWLLIYKIEGEYLILERTGTHSELFR